MKNRLNITISEVLIEQAQQYAEKHNTSLSALVEEYFISLTHRRAKKNNILEYGASLPKPKSNTNGYNKESYYEERKHKYRS